MQVGKSRDALSRHGNQLDAANLFHAEREQRVLSLRKRFNAESVYSTLYSLRSASKFLSASE